MSGKKAPTRTPAEEVKVPVPRHPRPRKAAAEFLAAGWCAGSLRAWYEQVRRHHPEEADAVLLPVVRQAVILENRAAKGVAK